MNRATDTATIRELLEHASQEIRSETPRLDAEVLLAHVLDRPRSHLLAWPDRIPATAQQTRYHELVARRTAGEPVAYLTGAREFWSLPLAVSPDTLIPRPDTETLVAHALSLLPLDSTASIADLGTGSGAIALALAHERPGCRVLATDRSQAALSVARDNARRLGIDNMQCAAGDWCAALAGRRFDLVISNPPYIPDTDPHLEQGDVRFEPRAALASGPAGLDDIRRIAACARDHLADSAWLLLEHGFDQADAVTALLAELGYRDIRTVRDESGHPRVTCGRAPGR